MAVVARHEVYIQFWDAAERLVPWSVFISEADAKAYVAAADQAARDATDVGILITRTKALSDCTVLDYGVSYKHREDTTVAPTGEDTLRGNKAVFSGRGYQNQPRSWTIPGRDMNDITAQPSGGKMVIVLDDAGAVADWVSSMESTALDLYGGAVTITAGTLND